MSSDEIIDRDACMGSGNCLFWAPAVFDLDDDGVATVIGDVVAHEEAVRVAASHCPTSAIRIDGLFTSDAP
jgi:ferredoxin